jgi:serine/threonine protein kinase
VVYKARHLGLNRLVALKMILAGSQAGEDMLQRFQAEAEAVAKLQHPNIVQIYDVGRHDGCPFIALEYVDGVSLDKHLAATPQPPEQAARLVATLAEAMQAAHERGILHRDLKPANVLLQKNQNAEDAENRRERHELARRAGVRRLIVNGSFVTDVLEPNDVDCVLLIGAEFPRDPAAEVELRQGLPFIDLHVVGQQDFDLFVATIFGTDRAMVPKGVVEVTL